MPEPTTTVTNSCPTNSGEESSSRTGALFAAALVLCVAGAGGQRGERLVSTRVSRPSSRSFESTDPASAVPSVMADRGWENRRTHRSVTYAGSPGMGAITRTGATARVGERLEHRGQFACGGIVEALADQRRTGHHLPGFHVPSRCRQPSILSASIVDIYRCQDNPADEHRLSCDLSRRAAPVLGRTDSTCLLRD